jgi:sugar phosphate permease
VAGTFGWRATFRYPVLWIGFMSLVFWPLARDKPLDVALPDYVEEDAISGAASSLLDAHAYLYNGLQGFVIGWILDATGGNWRSVFLLLAVSRILSASVMAAVKA